MKKYIKNIISIVLVITLITTFCACSNSNSLLNFTKDGLPNTNEEKTPNISNKTIAVSDFHSVAVLTDGTVLATGSNEFGQCNVNNWTDIIAVEASDEHTIGLKSDGTVLASGSNEFGQCNVGDWTNIVSIETTAIGTFGVKSDGTVVATGSNERGECNVTNWTDIISVSATNYGHTVGLKSDGTVVATGNNQYGQCNVSEWTDIIMLATGWAQTFGLKSDGTVVAVGSNNDIYDDSFGGYIYTPYMQNVVFIDDVEQSCIGLKFDGTACASGQSSQLMQTNGAIQIDTAGDNIMFLYPNGTVSVMGDNSYGQTNVTGWTGVKINQ